MNATVALNFNTLGHHARLLLGPDPGPSSLLKYVAHRLDELAIIYGIPSDEKFDTIIAVEPLDIFKLDNNTLDHLNILRYDYSSFWKGLLALLHSRSRRVVHKIPGGNPAPWTILSPKTLAYMLEGWSDALRPDDVLIADGLHDKTNFAIAKSLVPSNVRLGTGLLPGHDALEYDRRHLAKFQLMVPRMFHRIDLRLRALPKLDESDKTRSLFSWMQPLSDLLADEVDTTEVVVLRRGDHPISYTLELCRHTGATPCVLNGGVAVHRAVADFLASRDKASPRLEQSP